LAPSGGSHELFRDLSEGWSSASYILSGLLLWGGIGMLADRVLGTDPWLMVVGALLGHCAGIYLVWIRTFRRPPDAS
jgi:F0F1-type ATP synthase assembly protein I